MKVLVLATILAIGSAGLAAAADAVVDEVVVDSAYNWSGVYVGGQIGYVFDGNVDHDYQTGTGTDADFNYRLSPDGVFGALYLGYNYQFGNGVVLGAEGDVAWGDVEASGETVTANDPSYDSTTEIDWTGSARVRLGYAMDRFLPYATGGVAFGHFDFEEREDGDFYGEGSGDLVGWTLGAGAEYAITDNWILRGEYRYTEFDEEEFVSDTGGRSEEDFTARIRTHDVRIGAAYKF